MALDELAATIETLKRRINDHRASLAANETRTRQVLIDPLLMALGWDVSDPTQVELEYSAGQGKADYALIGTQGPVAVIEAKRLGETLDEKHVMQVLNYANSQGIGYMVVCNGDEWRMYDVFKQAQLSERLIMELKVGTLPSYDTALKSLSLWRPNLGSGLAPTMAGEPIIAPTGPENCPPIEHKLQESIDAEAVQADSGWESLANLSVENGTKPPTKIRIGGKDIVLPPHNDKRPSPPYTNWTGFLVSFAKWLVASGNLDRTKCPITIHANSDLSLIADKPVHPSGSEFHSGERIGGGLWINKNLSTPNKRRSLIHLLKNCGFDPSTVQVKID